jgi:hypothetical protein
VGAGVGFAPGATGDAGADGVVPAEPVLGAEAALDPPLAPDEPVLAAPVDAGGDEDVAAVPPVPGAAVVVVDVGCFCWVKGSRADPLGCVLEGELLTVTAAIGVPLTGPCARGSAGAGADACLLSTTGTATIAAIRASGTGHSRRWWRSFRIPLRKLIADWG